MSRRSAWVAALGLVLVAGAAEAKPRQYSWEIHPYIASRDYDDSLGGLSTHGVRGIRLGYNLTRRWEVEAGFSMDPGNHDRTNFRRDIEIQTLDLGVVLNFNTDPPVRDQYGRWTGWNRWVPFITAAVGNFSANDELTGSREDTTGTIGGGTRLMIADWIGIRGDVRYTSSLDSKDFDESFGNFEGGLGVTFILGGGTPRDSDSDGVIDGLDKCPGTPLGCWVDENGCPRDSDGDGVCDGLDRCPNTPAGCTVDANGCPLDEDGDGVCDALDNCPGTPTGCWVDEHGCPRDSDKDGVCDGVDKCPDTPEGCKVDAQGCPLDGDGDGVCDGIDQCPDTARGVRVDARGCPVGHLLISNVYFEFNKSEIRPFYQAILDEVAKSLLQGDWRVLEIELRGHTDAIDTVEYNYRLGQARADAVKDYLVSKGVAPARLVTKSYSELEPAAPNTLPSGADNPEGRALNRRVEMVPSGSEATGRTNEVKILARDVMFRANSAELTDEGRSYLDEMATAFSGDLGTVRFDISGSGRGDLAQQRAEAVASYLESKGVSRDRLMVSGDGGRGDRVVITPRAGGNR
jgi:outer membrane protein OmpA-like peptidoglycan-associated protein